MRAPAESKSTFKGRGEAIVCFRGEFDRDYYGIRGDLKVGEKVRDILEGMYFKIVAPLNHPVRNR